MENRQGTEDRLKVLPGVLGSQEYFKENRGPKQGCEGLVWLSRVEKAGVDTQAETGVLRSTEEGNGRCVQTDGKASEELHWRLNPERQIQAALARGAVVEPAVLDEVGGGVEVGQTVMGCDTPCKTMVRAGFLHQPHSCWEKLLFFPPL